MCSPTTMLNNISRRKNTCSHNVYIKGLCGNCGARLDPPQSTSVSMIHSVPELKVSEEYAKEIGKADQEKLIQERKLVLLVDLDQTILHTTHEEVRNNPNIHSFTLWPGHPTYYTKLRPHLSEFLEEMSKIYELHIFTFGCRMYAHKIASIIDPEQKYFGHRILSRDESVDQYCKRGNLNNLFPCGDAMVCIIDDRADVWKDAGNLIQVKPYSYFKTSISDGAYRSASDDDESLDRDADKLEALLGVDEDDEDDRDSSETKKQDEDKVQVTSTEKIDSDTDDDEDREKEVKRKKISVDEQKPETQSSEAEISEEKSTPPINDTDDHLLHLISILGRVHEKWYLELDEQRRFLVDGENYKLPDIKDIIKRYLRKKF